MWQFNLIVTLAADGRFRHLWEELALYGEFRKTDFFGVILGQVAEPRDFLELVREKSNRQLTAFQDLGRLVPLADCFGFTPETFETRLHEAVDPFVERLNGQRFYVRFERRGLKGRIISPEVERNLDAFLLERLEQCGGAAEVDFVDPDLVMAVETIGMRCGIGLLTKEMRERYPFVRVP